MADIEIISDWLKRADEDFQFAVVNLKEQKPFYAVQKSQYLSQNQQALEQFLLPLVILDFDHEAARTHGKLRAWLETRGKTIGALDMLIAAHALSKGLPLATNNVREFSRVPGLRVINWT